MGMVDVRLPVNHVTRPDPLDPPIHDQSNELLNAVYISHSGTK